MPVYLIRCEATGATKIGVADDPIKRLKELQTGSPGKLWVRAILGGDRETEAALHRRFQSFRTNGEWFNLTEEQIRAIEIEHSDSDLTKIAERLDRIESAMTGIMVAPLKFQRPDSDDGHVYLGFWRNVRLMAMLSRLLDLRCDAESGIAYGKTIDRIAMVSDHEGTLEVHWKIRPDRDDLCAVQEAWGDVWECCVAHFYGGEEFANFTDVSEIPA